MIDYAAPHLRNIPKYNPALPLTKREYVKAVITGWIRDGHYTPGTRLPTDKELQKLFGMSPMVTCLAKQELRDIGLLVIKRSDGTFVDQNALLILS